MGFILKSPVTNLQSQVANNAFQTAASIGRVHELIQAEANNRSNADINLQRSIYDLSNSNTQIFASINNNLSSLQEDLNSEIITRQSETAILDAAISTEIANRDNADSSLLNLFNSSLDCEKINRSKEIADMKNAILASMGNSEAAAQIENDKLRAQIEAEAANQTANISALSGRLDDEIADRLADSAQLSDKIAAESSQRSKAISNLHNTFNQAITSEAASRQTAINNTHATLLQLVNDEASNRTDDISNLQNNIDTVQTTLQKNLADEIAARTANLNQLQAALTTARDNLQKNLAQEIQDRLDSVAALEVKLDNISVAAGSDISDFTSPTATTKGKRGLVPESEAGTELKILTNFGWRELDEATLTIASTPTQTGVLTFNGDSQIPQWLNFDASKLKIEGTTSAANVGVYNVTFTPIGIYLWADTLDQEPRAATWQIDILKLNKPTAAVTEFAFDSNSHTLNVSNFNEKFIDRTGTITSTVAGNYAATFSLKSKSNTSWADDSTDEVVINWKIVQLKFTKPTVGTTNFTYNGNTQGLTVANFNSEYQKQTGTVSAVNAGSYTATFALKNKADMTWNDGTVDDVIISWKISALKLNRPSASTTEFTYDAAKHTVTVANYNATYMTQSGTSSSTNAGSFKLTYSLKNKTNTTWADGTTANVVINWAISALKLQKPEAAVVAFDYDGAAKSLNVSNYNSGYMTQTGDVSATDIGDYSVTYSLKNKSNTTWADGTTADVVISWAISGQRLTQAQSTFSQSATLTYNGAERTANIKNYDADYHVMTGATSATNAGSYAVQIAPVEGYYWYDGTNEPKTVTWKIGPIAAVMPEFSKTSYSYTGETIAPQYRFSLNTQYLNISGTQTATAVGTYKITYKLKDKANYCWTNGGNADIVLSWSIVTGSVAKPTVTSTEFTYDGNLKSLAVTGYDSNKMTQSGDLQAITAGDYEVTYSLKSGYAWEDGTTGAVVFSWSIARQKLSVAQGTFSQKGTLTYTGSEQTVTIENYDSAFHVLSGTTSATNGGTFNAKIVPAANYAWNDGTTSEKAVAWKINPKTLAKPTATVTDFSYDKAVHSLTLSGFDSNTMSKSGTEKATAAGNYTLRITLQNTKNTIWADETTDAVVISWRISKLTLTKPTIEADTFTYNGSAKTLSVTGYDSKYMVQSGVTQATDAGDYQVTFTLLDADTTAWADGSTSPVVINWTVSRDKLYKSNLKYDTSYIYSGNKINFVGSKLKYKVGITYYPANWNNFTDRLTLEGQTSGVDVGTYTFTVTPTANYMWSDGTTEPYAITWYITPRAQDLAAVDDTVLTFNSETQTPTLTGFDSGIMTLGGTTSATDAGDYTLTVTLNNNYYWEGTDNQRVLELTWTINRLPMKYTHFKINNHNWTGSKIFPAVKGYPGMDLFWAADYGKYVGNDMVEGSGDTFATEVGEHVLTLTPKANYAWNDGTFAPLNISWKITSRSVGMADFWKSAQAYQYDGTQKMLTSDASQKVELVSNQYYTVTGTTHATEAGNYSATVSLIDKVHYYWSDYKTYGLQSDTDDIVLNWSIGVEAVEVPTLSQAYFDYDGAVHAVTVTGFDETTMTQSGTVSASARGFYQITFSLKNKTGNCWASGGNADIVYEWAIGKKRLDKPYLPDEAASTFTYDGHSKTYGLTGYDVATMNMTGVLSATEAGDYSVKIALRDKAAGCWADGSTSDLTFNWTINRRSLALSKELIVNNGIERVYTGKTQKVNSSIGYYSSISRGVIITGDTEAVNAGNYTVQITPDSNHCWNKGLTDAVTLTWTISPAPITAPTLAQNSFEYDGEAKTLTFKDFDSEKMTVSGDTQTNAGNYAATVQLKDKNNYIWSGADNSNLSFDWKITPIYLTPPTASPSSQTQGGSTKTVTLNGFDSANMSLTKLTYEAPDANWKFDIDAKFYTLSGNTLTLKLSYRNSNNQYEHLILSGGEWGINNFYGVVKIHFEALDSNHVLTGGGLSSFTMQPFVISEELSALQQEVEITYDGSSHSWKEAFPAVASKTLSAGEISTSSSYFSKPITVSISDNVLRATEVGTYTLKVYPAKWATWSDGTYSERELTFTISAATPQLSALSVSSNNREIQAAILDLQNAILDIYKDMEV